MTFRHSLSLFLGIFGIIIDQYLQQRITFPTQFLAKHFLVCTNGHVRQFYWEKATQWQSSKVKGLVKIDYSRDGSKFSRITVLGNNVYDINLNYFKKVSFTYMKQCIENISRVWIGKENQIQVSFKTE